jgi:uncharacterized membrane protein
LGSIFSFFAFSKLIYYSKQEALLYSFSFSITYFISLIVMLLFIYRSHLKELELRAKEFNSIEKLNKEKLEKKLIDKESFDNTSSEEDFALDFIFEDSDGINETITIL